MHINNLTDDNTSQTCIATPVQYVIATNIEKKIMKRPNKRG